MVTMRREDLMPLALSHDQTASHCAWVQLTRSTGDYPSRRAQAAMALLAGTIESSRDLVDLMYRCDGCHRCVPAGSTEAEAFSELLYDARAELVGLGLVGEAERWTANWQTYGTVFGDISASLSRVEPGGNAGLVAFVPGDALLWLDSSAAQAAWRLSQMIEPEAVVDTELTDSGFVLRELGLVDLYESERSRVRDYVADRGYETVIAGTPKTGFELSRVLAGLPVTVITVLDLLVDRLLAEADATSTGGGTRGFVLHPSDYLSGQRDEIDRVERALSTWLGYGFRTENRGSGLLWPAAIERPSVAGNRELEQRLAENRADQMLDQTATRDVTILTLDPFSRRALAGAVDGRAEVLDLISFVMNTLEGGALDG